MMKNQNYQVRKISAKDVCKRNLLAQLLNTIDDFSRQTFIKHRLFRIHVQ